MASSASLLLSPEILSFSRSSFTASDPPASLSGVWLKDSRDKWAKSSRLSWICNGTYKSSTQVKTDRLQNYLPEIDWQEIIKRDSNEGEVLKVSELSVITKLVDMIRAMLDSMNDGEMSISAYDTAWVALVEDIHDGGAPQFPSSLQWIVENQLPDGSWGDPYIFSAHDRIINTLACVIALKSWKMDRRKCEKGMSFIRENMRKLEDEKAEHMPIGFEVAFPSLMEIARKLDLEVPEDSPVLQEIYAKRNLKLTRIPKDIMHTMPTTLLHSLEGMAGLDWEKLLKLQCLDGSFLFSPSSTAFALMQTKDENCLQYLNRTVKRFNGGVPNVYPVDLFEHIWVLDRLDRLGISRYFQSEIKDCLNYIHRYWSEDGICWARNSQVHDIDDTAMGFRLLRLHGYNVSADVFQHFKKGGEFFCFVGQSNQAVTGIFNLFRASQILFPGEKILEEAKEFSSKFLREKQASKQLLDKWIITKDLPGEVRYALDVPWYASLPRIEARYYIDQYGGENDVWIGKTLYRMPYVSNNAYLELAKLDFNKCQALHQLEWVGIQKWYTEYNLQDFGLNRRTLLEAYFVAMASIFEPKRSPERLTWTRTTVLIEVISSFLKERSVEERATFVHDFINICISDEHYHRDSKRTISNKTGKQLIDTIVGTLNYITMDVLMADGSNIRNSLRRTWMTWMQTWQSNEDKHQEAELLVRTIALCSSRCISEDILSHPHFDRLAQLTDSVCHQLRLMRMYKDKRNSHHDAESNNISTVIMDAEASMQEVVQCVLGSSDGLDREIKQMFLTIAKSFYYTAHCTPAAINRHIAKVLFKAIA